MLFDGTPGTSSSRKRARRSQSAACGAGRARSLVLVAARLLHVGLMALDLRRGGALVVLGEASFREMGTARDIASPSTHPLRGAAVSFRKSGLNLEARDDG